MTASHGQFTHASVAPRHLYHRRDGARYARLVILYTLLSYAHFGLCLADILPWWTMWLSLPVLAIRWMLALHELFHLRSADEVDRFIALMPLAVTPLFIGYREYREIHKGHHAYMATPRDPDYFHIRGTPLSGLLNAMTAPEQIFVRWVVQHPLSTPFLLGVLLRLGIFAGLIALAGWQFLWFWVPLRLAHGIGYFGFFYCLHRRGGAYGVYPLVLPPVLRIPFRVLFGRDALLATSHHDVHHAHAGIAASHLDAYSQPGATAAGFDVDRVDRRVPAPRPAAD